MQSVLAVLFVLGALIFFHELGHFLVARVLGIGVRAFSLGFGPRLAKKRIGATEYRLSAVPLGGYVLLAGEQPGEKIPDGFTAEQCFNQRPSWQKMCVVAAGPVFNFVLAWLIYWGLFWSQGLVELAPVVGQIKDGSPAQVAGIQPGDRFLAIDGQKIPFWNDLSQTVRASGGRPLRIEIERDRSLLTKTVTPELHSRKNIFGEEIQVPLIGVMASGETVAVQLSGGSSAWEAAVQTWGVIRLTVEGIVKLIERIIPIETVGGPIMIAQMVSEQAKAGLAQLLALTAVISINLGLINLLPIPVLDGGHIVFFALETLFRRPLSPRVMEITTKVGLFLIISLMALALYNDLTRILAPAPL